MIEKNEYIDLIKKSDKGAFESFFKQYYALLCNFAFTFLKEKEASEEIIQGLFCKIWENRDTIEITISEKAYLFSAVKNLCLNQIKHIDIREKYKEFNRDSISNNQQIENDVLVETELSERIFECIEHLPQQRKIIFKLSRDEGLKYKEIAETLNISIKTVEAQMSSALKYLREQLSDYLVLMFFLFFF